MTSSGGLPFRLALLFAVPLGEADFLAAAAREPRSDYLTHLIGRRTPQQAWDGPQGYARVSQAGQRLFEHAQQLGAEVVTDAGRADLRRATEGCEVVILCAHWRGEAVAQADIRGAPDAIADAVQATPGREGEILRSALTPVLAASTANDDVAWRRDLARTLNRLILDGVFTGTLGLVDPHEREVLGPALARAVIDETLAPYIAGGNRLELADGLLSEGEVEATIAPDFSGQLDLSVCQSAFLARYLAARRADQPRRPIFLHGQKHLLPVSRLTTLIDTLTVCAEQQQPYYEARALVEEALMRAFDKTGSKTTGGSPWAWLESWANTIYRQMPWGSAIARRSRRT